MALSTPINSRSRLTFVRILRHAALPRITIVTASFLFACLLFNFPHSSRTLVRADSRESKAIGATLFHERGREHCHGVDGHGGDLGPNLSTIGKRWKKPQIEHQIHDGGAGMPPFGDVLQPDEIKALVDYLHAKRRLPKSRTAQAQPAPANSPVHP
jgi:mono/diheme cytochrome c family protein